MKSYAPNLVTVGLWLIAIATAPLPPYWISPIAILVAGFCMAQDVEDMPPWLRLPLWDIPVWLLYSAVAIVLNAIGLVLLLPLSACHAWRRRPSKVFPFAPHAGFPITAWRGGWLTWLWGNEEDGVTGPQWWLIRTGATVLPSNRWKLARAAYRWSALRNPSNNMRFIPGVNPVIEPSRIQSVRAARWIFTWQGPFAGFIWFPRIGEKVFRFWIGWKLKPEDAQGVDDHDMRKPRCGFAMQFKRVA